MSSGRSLDIQSNFTIQDSYPTIITTYMENQILRNIVDTYITVVNHIGVLEYVTERERYKFETVEQFQKNFNLEVVDLATMLEKSIPSNNLTIGNMFYARKALLIFAKEYTDETRDALRYLFDETQDIVLRLNRVTAKFDELQEREDSKIGKKQMHDLQLRFLTFLLSVRYPDRYYPIKAQEFKHFIQEILGESYKFKRMSIGEQYTFYERYASQLTEYIKTREDIQEIKHMLTENLTFQDEASHWMTQDIIFTFEKVEKILKDNEPAYYWVNQGDNYSIERNGGYIWAPDNEDVHTHKRIQELTIGDTILHYSKGAIRAISKVQEMPKSSFYPEGEKWQNKEGHLVKVLYEDLLHPITSEELKQKFKNHKNLLPEKYSPFDKDLFINQGYLFNFNKNSYDIIFSKEDHINEPTIEYKTMFTQPLNQILYGPPGTGKTYTTINAALDIIHKEAGYAEKKENIEGRKAILEEYNALRESGQIQFITFHQSYSYEEFIEGIRPNVRDGGIGYELKQGVFKQISNNASLELPKNTTIEFTSGKNIHKISLGNSQDAGENSIYRYCIENNVIGTGYGQNVDYSGADDKAEIEKRFTQKYSLEDETKFNIDAIERFKNWMKIGDLFIVSKGNKYIRAVGRVTSDYYYVEDPDIKYHHFRNVEWLLKDVEIPISSLTDTKLSQQSIYIINNVESTFYENLKLLLTGKKNPNDVKNFVLIIDEINRGNISKIFGELITLLEEDKRIGALHELKVTLPYSNEDFGVPKNLYIIGTMNTADRSIALLDIALRRRFVFQEMPPKYDVLQKAVVEDLELSTLLQKLNKKIRVLIDADHQIGHSYFMTVLHAADKQEALHQVWYRNIIPLLQEYFYNDWEKLTEVLGRYKSSEERGFVRIMPRNEINDSVDEDYEDFSIGEIVVYSPEVLVSVLKNYCE